MCCYTALYIPLYHALCSTPAFCPAQIRWCFCPSASTIMVWRWLLKVSCFANKHPAPGSRLHIYSTLPIYLIWIILLSKVHVFLSKIPWKVSLKRVLSQSPACGVSWDVTVWYQLYKIKLKRCCMSIKCSHGPNMGLHYEPVLEIQ